MDALTVFRLATIDGAKALHLENEIGSIEIGKKADLVFLNLEKPNLTLNEENIYSSIIFSASSENVEHVMINGNWVVKNGESLIYDENKLYNNGKTELSELLKRSKLN
jgi:5-methylthioadenosine/S-adenosylhomocysteine deaminase